MVQCSIRSRGAGCVKIIVVCRCDGRVDMGVSYRLEIVLKFFFYNFTIL